MEICKIIPDKTEHYVYITVQIAKHGQNSECI